MKLFLLAVALLHGLFMLAELLPPEKPLLLDKISSKLPKQASGEAFTEPQLKLVAKIVQNAGIYNSIIAGGLLWAALTGDLLGATAVAKVILIGAAVAGLFGTLTLRSPLTALQALAGIAGFLLVNARGI